MEGNVIQGAAAREEQDQNMSLRRLDWRFLLADPHPQRTACQTGERLAQTLKLISKEVVPLYMAEPESCDLAVITNPSMNSLLAAFHSLCPDGNFYGEWYSSMEGGPSKIRNQLSRAGFEDIEFYWPWPWPERGATLFWLPLEAPAALEYFFQTRPPSQAIIQKFFRSALRTAWKAARWARLLVPVCVTARKRHPGAVGWKSSGRGQVEHDQRDQQGLKVDCRPESLRWLMLTGGLSSLNKVVKFGFNPNEKMPCLVVKHARVAESIPALVREAQNLERVASLTSPDRLNVPRLLFLDRKQETAAVGETVVSGDPLYTHLRGDNYRSWALEATHWLRQLVKSEVIVPRTEWWGRVVEPALDAFDRKYARELGTGIVGRIQDRLHPLQSLPLTFEHRDFSPWNVLVTESSQLAVLDWEGGEPEGIPGMDLIYFLTFLAFFYDGAMESGRFRQSYRSARDPQSFTGSIQTECFRIYFEGLGLDPGIVLPLSTLAWTIHSLSVFPRLGPQAGKRGAEEPGLFIQLLAEDLERN